VQAKTYGAAYKHFFDIHINTLLLMLLLVMMMMMMMMMMSYSVIV